MFDSSSSDDTVTLQKCSGTTQEYKLKAKVLCHADVLVQGGVYIQSEQIHVRESKTLRLPRIKDKIKRMAAEKYGNKAYKKVFLSF